MTSALKVFLMLALLLQGAVVSAMPMAKSSAMSDAHAMQMDASMPCHDMAGADESKMSCCGGDGQLCQAMCAAIALPATLVIAPMSPTPVVVLLVPQSNVLPAHRASPLRPPISLSA